MGLPDDRTARARIRDEALRLFAAKGAAAITIREVATAAGVSPALVIQHFGSKDGLREAADEHVIAVFEAMLAPVTERAAPMSRPDELPTLAEMVAQFLPPGSSVPAYLIRMLVDGGAAGSALFRRLYAVATEALDLMICVGTADGGADPAVRAAFLLLNDLAVLTFRNHLADVLGEDPLSVGGLQRWGAEVLAVYGAGLGGNKQPREESRTHARGEVPGLQPDVSRIGP